MKILKMYQYWDEKTQQIVQSFTPKYPNTDLIVYVLIADQGKYMYNISTKAIRSSITVPFYAKDDWEERAYE